MREILNDIIYLCGAIFLFYIGCVIIGMIILKIKEITYDAHQNLMELNNLKRKCKKAREEIEQLRPNNPNFEHYKGETRVVNQALAIIDKLIESEG